MCTTAYISSIENPVMSDTTTLTVRLPSRVKKRLGRLAAHTKRTRSYLAGEAIADFVEREMAIVESIQEGLDDVKAGRVVAHEQVMSEAASIIEKAKRKQIRR
jgi:predicted transcriptional regulator